MRKTGNSTIAVWMIVLAAVLVVWMPLMADGETLAGSFEVAESEDEQIFYVDPENGDDAFSGLARSYAKRTIDGAYASVTNHDATIVLLRGTHPSPSGSFSTKYCAPEYRVHFIGENGPSQTIIDGGGERCLTGCMEAFTSVEGCTLRGFACKNVNWQTFWGLQFTNCVFTGDFRRATSDHRRLFLQCVFYDCRADINLTYGTDYDDSSGYYGNGTECFYGCVIFDSIVRISSSGNPHRFDGCSYFENCFIELEDITRLTAGVDAPHYNVLGKRQRFVDTTLIVKGATDWTSGGGFLNCLLGLCNDEILPALPNLNSSVLTNEQSVSANIDDNYSPTVQAWRPFGYNREQTELDHSLRMSLSSSKDAALTNVSERSTYAAYREWATSVKTSDGNGPAGVDAVKSAPNAWLSFAVASPQLLDESISESDLKIDSFKPPSEGNQVATLKLGVKNVEISSDAMIENLKKLFKLEGSESLDEGAFSTDNISVEFDYPKDGNVTIFAKPKTSSRSFFFRLKK